MPTPTTFPSQLRSDTAIRACVAGVALAGTMLLGNEVRSQETVVAYADFASPPYQYVDSAGRPAGLDIDVFESAARAAGMTPEVRSLEAFVKDGRWVRLGAIDSESMAGLASTLPYASTTHRLYSAEDSLVRGIEDLRHTEVAVVGSNGPVHDYLRSHGFGDNLRSFESVEAAFQALANGKVETAILETYAAKDVLASGSFDDVNLIATNLIQHERSFGIPLDDTLLLTKMEEGFRTVSRTGQYDRMLAAHLGDRLAPGRVEYASAKPFFGKLWILGTFVGVALALSILLKYLQTNFGIRERAHSLEQRLAQETSAQQDLRLAVARQQFVINRMSTTALVDQILEASNSEGGMSS